MEKTFAIVNGNSSACKGKEIWDKIFPDLEKEYGPIDVFISYSLEESELVLQQKIESGVRNFIAAGGDGAVNFVLNTIIQNKKNIPLNHFTIGAVGLGSSNDFHKPFKTKIQKIPVRVNFASSHLRDVASVKYRDLQGKTQTHYFLVSSSVGIVADANKNFNRNSKFLNFLKRNSTDLAILYAFFYTLKRYKNFPIKIKFDGKEGVYHVSYLAISKTRHISGMFHFKDDIETDDGQLLVKLLHNYSKAKLIWAMLKFAFGKENGLTNLKTTILTNISMVSEDYFIFEMDGETVECDRVDITVYKEKIKVSS